jgi:hypothetical protein
VGKKEKRGETRRERTYSGAETALRSEQRVTSVLQTLRAQVRGKFLQSVEMRIASNIKIKIK